ncbi:MULTISPECIES: ABC-F family ATP-binding cassette domain-containing protein [unclassified Mucilaginibacter]|uniref:ABC-F family ATP-binding cassette domain-containing protein n=1 Tax=unclassified Mucilaginibacter TaxID=2617802 RepID=UPI000960F7AE|nr:MULTISPECIES: ABC-F family ATP-binding cassette domain-containing protein [unclassified Mucilaginibacter]OJW15371.1 MAG: ABC transporter ATP-binding protein [Mucilaginibacter sp. 44-25]PLW90243.1 MAG: ABC transporter ATP-binding protein [Mucilaginibacter sp.]HEK20906.1 ABC transporter ATP-binding protein [Bacteroidota bacterium]
MIAINNLTFEIGARALYDEANWHIKPGEKIGLIGANGTGKTTLLKIIVGDYKPTSGTISMAKDLTMGYLNQDLLSYSSDKNIVHVAMEAFERQNQLHDEIENLLKKLETDYSEDLLNKLSDKQHEFELLDGYNIEYKAHEILAGLGFSEADCQRKLSTFSGGWRMRVMLAKILLQAPDILLLDEPTNHLDLPSIQWLEDYLKSFEGAIIIVSHDRWFLDKVINRTVESRKGKLTVYAGNYSFYLEEKELRSEIQRGEFKNQQAKIRQEERLIERFRAKASKAKMAQSRIKMLDKMERVDDVDDDNPEVNFSFKFSKQSGRHVVTLEHITKKYPGIDILEDAEAVIEKGDKIALIGANGKGKSTLLRIVAGADKDFEGTAQTGHNVTQTFFAQHQLESLHLENQILQELQSFAPKHTDTELRSILGSFLFTGDDVFKKIKVLSGGEKSRVALAKALTADANFLVLDEPTNHLDMASVNILIQALQQYEGTVIVVSHDRYFLDNVANKIWFIEDQKIKQYPGTYQEYDEWNAKRKLEPKAAPAPQPKKEEKKPEPVKQPADNKAQQLKKMNHDLTKLEELVGSLEKEVKNLEAQLADTSLYNQADKLQKLTDTYQLKKLEMREQQARWEALAEQIMELEG